MLVMVPLSSVSITGHNPMVPSVRKYFWELYLIELDAIGYFVRHIIQLYGREVDIIVLYFFCFHEADAEFASMDGIAQVVLDSHVLEGVVILQEFGSAGIRLAPLVENYERSVSGVLVFIYSEDGIIERVRNRSALDFLCFVAEGKLSVGSIPISQRDTDIRRALPVGSSQGIVQVIDSAFYRIVFLVQLQEFSLAGSQDFHDVLHEESVLLGIFGVYCQGAIVDLL